MRPAAGLLDVVYNLGGKESFACTGYKSSLVKVHLKGLHIRNHALIASMDGSENTNVNHEATELRMNRRLPTFQILRSVVATRMYRQFEHYGRHRGTFRMVGLIPTSVLSPDDHLREV